MREIPLTQGKVALVDDEDFAGLSQWKWYAKAQGRKRRHFYAVRCAADGSYIYMHRAILRPAAGEFVDHISGDSLDNRRANLRAASLAENSRNRRGNSVTGLKGVLRKGKLWRARIWVNRRMIDLGYHNTPILAAHAYDAGAKEHHGAFARLNFP